jgi:predicted alpha/beta superfamily hydrolase
MRYLLTFLLIFASTAIHAKPVQLPNTDIKYIKSKENDIDYKLYINLPEGYYDKKNFSYREKYSVLYVLDGDVDFAMIKNIADTMINFGTIEPMIIIGIGYKRQELKSRNSKIFWEKYMLNRTRDYIPSQLTQDVDKFMTERVDGYKFVPNHWNGERFRNFIEKELINYVNKNYRTSNQNSLLGHSLGGLFASHMMLSNSTTFNKYMILSPVIGIDSLIRNLDKYKSKKEIKSYFAVGSLEEDEKSSMVKDLEIFYSKLPKNNIKSKIDIINDEDHVSILPIGVTKGLRFLFNSNNYY